MMNEIMNQAITFALNNAVLAAVIGIIALVIILALLMGSGRIFRKLFDLMANNAVPAIFIIISAFAIPLSGYSASYLVQELLTRIGRNSFLILSLLIPIMAGMGLNFGMVLGAMAGQIGLLMICDWGVVGIPGMILACLVGTPIAVILGIFCGAVLNRAKGREMVTSYILGFFINGVYQLVVLYFMGWIIPITNPALLLSRGYGVRNAVSLLGIRGVLDNLTQCQRERCILPRAYSVL